MVAILSYWFLFSHPALLKVVKKIGNRTSDDSTEVTVVACSADRTSGCRSVDLHSSHFNDVTHGGMWVINPLLRIGSPPGLWQSKTDKYHHSGAFELNFKIKLVFEPDYSSAYSICIYIIFRILSSSSSFPVLTLASQRSGYSRVITRVQTGKQSHRIKQQVDSGGFVASLVANVVLSRRWEEACIDSLSICVPLYCQRQWNWPRSSFSVQWQTSCLGCKSNLPVWERLPAPTHYSVANTSRLKH